MPALMEGTTTLLIVDDREDVRQGLVWALQGEFQIVQASTRDQALAKLVNDKVDVVLCDLHLTDSEDTVEGLEVIAAARIQRPPVPVIVITGSRSRRAGLEAIKRGAYGYFEKPVKPDEAAHAVRQAAQLRRMEAEILRLRTERVYDFGFGSLVGNGTALSRIVKQARAVADSTATALIRGESGTGKELMARAIHFEGPRAAAPFVAVSCAALPESLIESELFGYDKGGFTNAWQSKKGRFEWADGGTLFLDEISELTLAVQVKLLRVLQERCFERIGGTKTINVDIRVIAASNRDLETEVKEGRFREDLFYRLNVIPLTMPPLRDRGEDILLIASFFVKRLAEKYRREPPTLSPELAHSLQEYAWPGNVRELENLMERLIVLTPGPEIGVEFLPDNMRTDFTAGTPPVNESLESAIHDLRVRMINKALKRENGNRAAAARRLDISRSYMHRLIKELGLEGADDKGEE